MADDALRVITAAPATSANVADETELPGSHEQHLRTMGSKLAQVTVAGEHDRRTAYNCLFRARERLRASAAA